MLSDIIKGLIAVIRGDNSTIYFQMLSHDFKQLEIQRLKQESVKRPGKIRKYSGSDGETEKFRLLLFISTLVAEANIRKKIAESLIETYFTSDD